MPKKQWMICNEQDTLEISFKCEKLIEGENSLLKYGK